MLLFPRVLRSLLLTAALMAAASPAAIAAVTEEPAPSMSAYFEVRGGGPGGSETLTLYRPEYRQSSYPEDTAVPITVVNTGNVPLVLENVHCHQSGPVEPQSSHSCAADITPLSGAPGTTSTQKITVRARAQDIVLTQDLLVRVSFYNVDPTSGLRVEAAASSAAPGQPVMFEVTKVGNLEQWGPSPGDTRHVVVGLTSRRFGNLLDTDNSALVGSTCRGGPALGTPAHSSCSYTARVVGEPGTTFDDTITLELSDGTGPTTTISTHVSLALTLPPVRDAGEWAKTDTPWPVVNVGDRLIDRNSSINDVFVLPRYCRGLGGVAVEDVLTVEPPARGWCRGERRLVRAAMTTLLNEAGRTDQFPATDPQAVVTETNRALRWFRIREMSRLTRQYEGWNTGA